MHADSPAPREVDPRPGTRSSGAQFHVVIAVTLLATAAACRDTSEREAVPAQTVAAGAAVPVPSLPECPNTTGRWDECNVRQRLERAGLAPQRLPDTLRVAFLDEPGVGYGVGHSVLRVFLYESAGALARDLADVDTATVQSTAGGPAVAWTATPTLITSNNMAAILLSDQATQIERVRLALTAGLPAPAPKR